MLTPTEWAYLAGLIDGEGSISIGRQSGKPTSAKVRFNNTDRDVIDWVKNRFGGLECEANSNSSYGKKICWRLDWNGSNTIPILEGMLPYLVIKGQLALVALEYLALTKNQGGTPKTIPSESWEKRDVLCQVASLLNAKGGK